MELQDIWPLFGLEITTPRLILRPVQDADLPGLARAALDGVHDPAVMPFDVPWTDASPTELAQNLAAFQWSLRNRVSPADWTVSFGVHFEGRVVGAQDLSARDFANRRSVETGSWLPQSAHGRGLGTEMRAGLLLFAFDVLDADFAESGAKSWNDASLAVSRKLGYQPNGVTRVAPRPGEVTDEQHMRLGKASFVRPDWSVSVRGAEPALAQLGVRMREK
ncbi:GNAT family N-acetyltransferase [Microbacterium paludicola]|uniref:GNAT family N-acetyltransferase n=1 Tax=Microbacterium paludicola TaxID=300019 RepID=UPI0011A90857|nr:GNAT family N-acetyltransferase [Microbacterium paludicola]